MHVTDMQLLWTGEHTLGHEVAATDHQLNRSKIDLFDRKGNSGRYCCTWLLPHGRF